MNMTYLKRYIQIGVCALLALLLFVLMLLEAFSGGGHGLEIKEAVAVSSAAVNASAGSYTSHLSGRVLNSSDGTIEIDRFLVTVANGEESETVTLPGTKLLPRTEEDLQLMFESTRPYDRVYAIKAVIAGEEKALSNNAGNTINPTVIWLAGFLALAVLALLNRLKMLKYDKEESELLK